VLESANFRRGGKTSTESNLGADSKFPDSGFGSRCRLCRIASKNVVDSLRCRRQSFARCRTTLRDPHRHASPAQCHEFFPHWHAKLRATTYRPKQFVVPVSGLLNTL